MPTPKYAVSSAAREAAHIELKLFIISNICSRVAKDLQLEPGNEKMPKFFRELRGNGEFLAKIQAARPTFPIRSLIEITIEKRHPVRAQNRIEPECYDSVNFPVAGTP